MIFLTFTFALLMLADFDSTRRVLSKGGVELNKPLAWLMAKIGVIPALALAKVLPAALVLYAVSVDQMPWQLLAALDAGYLGVVIWNYRQLYKEK